MYQLYTTQNASTPNAAMTINTSQTKSFLFDANNLDYQQFKIDLANGVELKDATGNVMTSQAVTEFLQGLQ